MAENELKAELDSATDAVRMLERERDERARAAADAVRAEYAERLREACKRRDAATQAVRHHIDATTTHPWDGKRVFMDKPIYSKWSAKQTGVERIEGIVEVVRQSSQFPNNMRWGRPSLGAVIIRKVKADGSPSLQIHRTYGNIMDNWTLAE